MKPQRNDGTNPVLDRGRFAVPHDGRSRRDLLSVAVAIVLFGATAASAGRSEITFESKAYRVGSGVHNGTTSEVRVAYTHLIDSFGAAWMRVRFGDYELGKNSYVVLQSTVDDEWQRFDARTLPEWQSHSGIFNGDAVVVELHVAPGDRGVFVEVDGVVIGRVDAEEAPAEGPGGVASLCGADDRTPSSNARVGRIWFNAPNPPNPNPARGGGGCTAWLVANGAVLTAGHCVDQDPDSINNASCGSGIPPACCTSALPDGVIDAGFLNAVVEFNVPASLSNGVPVAASTNDQYPVDGAFFAWQYPGCDQNSNFVDIQTNGVGTDWAVFSLGRNANTLLRAHIAQGAFHRVAALACTDDCTTCVEGYGVDNTPFGTLDSRCLDNGANLDRACTNTTNNCIGTAPECPGGLCCPPAGNNNARHLTQQRACGPYEDFHSEGTRRWHEYSADTTGATSGSPVTVDVGGRIYAIGINTHSGCPDGGNIGTAFIHATLSQWLNDFLGPRTVYADSGWGPCIQACDGTIVEPFPTVTAAVQAVGHGRTIGIVRGNYPASAGNTFTAGADGRAMTLVAPVGTATIGN